MKKEDWFELIIYLIEIMMTLALMLPIIIATLMRSYELVACAIMLDFVLTLMDYNFELGDLLMNHVTIQLGKVFWRR